MLFLFFFSVPVSRTASTSSNGGTCNKRLEATLTKFSTSALPFHLEVIQQRQANIERVRLQHLTMTC